MSPSAATIEESSVSALLLRLQQRELLVPKAMVADVLTWNTESFISAASNSSNWQLGKYQWREEQLPLICVEQLMQTKTAKDEILKRKIVILKACLPENTNRHYAIHCKGFPKPLILSEQSLNNLNTENHQEWIAHSISIGSRVLDVPDFAAIEGVIWHTKTDLHQSA